MIFGKNKNKNNKHSNQEIGRIGEKYAAKFLKKHKYKILDKNYRCRFGEIDIIVKNKEFIAFVEVKTRNYKTTITPALAVNKTKQNHIIRCAYNYLLTHKTDLQLKSLQPRFDVIEVLVDSQTLKLHSINHIRSAFVRGGYYAFV